MMFRASVTTLALAVGSAAFGQPVYPGSPDWESTHTYYSYGTGAAYADINGDGWLDLVVADGNDMALGPLNVYYNDGAGAFPTSASWQSADFKYNGHLDVADINGDGWIDVAVAHLGEFNTVGPIAKVYLNNNGTLSATPDWEADYDAPFGRIAAGDMFAAWVAHDLLHMRQLVELHWAYTMVKVDPYRVRYAGTW